LYLVLNFRNTKEVTMIQHYNKRIDNYYLLEPIGKGAFAEVYKGIHQHTKEEVAIKMIARKNFHDHETLIEKEISILKELKNTNIVRFLHHSKTLHHYYLIFEFCKHGDLDHFIKNFYNGKVPEIDAQKLIQQIVEGIKAMKTKNIVHRDLKLANILVSKDFTLKIADFGLARFLDNSDFLLQSFVGTPLNMDPLVLEKKGYSEKCDIWSLGVIFYQILLGKPPFNPGRGAGLMDLLALIHRQPVIFPSDTPLSDSVKDLIKRMLVYDVNKRMSFEELFNHDWITGKFSLQDVKKTSIQDLSAPQLLQSVYDLKKGSSKEKNQSGNSPAKLATSSPKKNENTEQKVRKLENVTENEKKRELYSAGFLIQSLKALQNKFSILKKMFIDIIKTTAFKKEGFNEKIKMLPVVVSVELLNMQREFLKLKFEIVSEKNNSVLFCTDVRSILKKIRSNKESLSKINSEIEGSLDLYDQIKNEYIEIIESFNQHDDEKEATFDQFKGYSLEKFIMDCLIQLSEDTAYEDYLEDDSLSKLDIYKICDQICELLMMINSFNKASFKIIEKKDGEKENEENMLSEYLKDFFTNEISLDLLSQMSTNENYIKEYTSIKDKIILSESEFASSDPSGVIKKLQKLLKDKILELEEDELEFSL